MKSTELTEQRSGVIAALAAFCTWGLIPIFFKWLQQVGLWEIIAHRIIWALPVLGIFLLVRDGRKLFPKLRISATEIGWLAVSGTLLALNWLLFVWAVVHDRVLATSLGYFITPLVNILLGKLFLQERLSSYQKVAVAIAALGTAYLAWFLGQPPWISLSLAFLFGTYGLLRKRLSVGPMTGLMWENMLLLGPAVAYMLWRNHRGEMDFLHLAPITDLVLLLAGLVTVLPLIWFNMATQKLRLSTVGFFTYLGPSMTMLLAVFLWHEPFTGGHAVAFACIWTGLALISFEQIRHLRRKRIIA